MNKTYIDTFKELFVDMSAMTPEGLHHFISHTPERLQSFISQTTDYFLQLRLKMSSSDPKEQEEAVNAALELQNALQAQVADLGKLMGSDLSQLSDPDAIERMDEKSRELLLNVKDQFRELQNSPKSAKKTHRRKDKIKLVG
jgi:hypothetical protein